MHQYGPAQQALADGDSVSRSPSFVSFVFFVSFVAKNVALS